MSPFHTIPFLLCWALLLPLLPPSSLLKKASTSSPDLPFFSSLLCRLLAGAGKSRRRRQIFSFLFQFRQKAFVLASGASRHALMTKL